VQLYNSIVSNLSFDMKQSGDTASYPRLCEIHAQIYACFYYMLLSVDRQLHSLLVSSLHVGTNGDLQVP
jgi:hypothetical protein